MAKIVAFEGVDGSGKTSLIKATAQQMEDAGFRVLTTRLVEDMFGFYIDWDAADGHKRGAYQKRISDIERTEVYAVEAYLKLKQLKQTDYDYILLDRWFPVIDYDLIEASDFQMVSSHPLLQQLGEADVYIQLLVPTNVAIERLVQKSDWMIDYFTKEELVMEIDKLKQKQQAKFERCSSKKYCLDAQKPLRELAHSLLNEIIKI